MAINQKLVETDVLIVGGGLAGLNAAMAAGEAGARVVIMDKGAIARSGCIGGGVDHFRAFMETGPEWDTREAYLQSVIRSARGVANLSVHNAVYCRGLKAAISRMEQIGNPLYLADGAFYRTGAFGRDATYSINFEGTHLKPKLARAARKAGAKALEKVMTTALLTENGRVTGALGFHIRTGDFYVIKAKAVIVSTGATNRLFENPTGLQFNTWQCPADTGEAQVMSLKAGATLANMEYMRITVIPKGFSAAGLGALTSLGGVFVNAAGEPFMPRYHRMGNAAPRHELVLGAFREIQEGRGPLYLDCTGIPADKMERLKATLGVDKNTLPDYFEQKGIDIAREPFEVQVAEGFQGGPHEGSGSGVLIDEQCASTVPGLFAAGDSSDQCRCVAMAVTSGYLAGQEAAKFAAAVRTHANPDQKTVDAERSRVYAPIGRKTGVTGADFEAVLGKIMVENVGLVRTEASLSSAIKKLERLDAAVEELTARNFHELMRAHEVQSMLVIGKAMVAASRERKETRFSAFHHRADYPETDDKNFCGQMLVRLEDGVVKTSFQPLAYDAIPEP